MRSVLWGSKHHFSLGAGNQPPRPSWGSTGQRGNKSLNCCPAAPSGSNRGRATILPLEPLTREPGQNTQEASAADLPADWHLAWDERAAIMEYDGGLPRERAESLALQEIIRQMQAQSPGMNRKEP